MDCVFFFPDEVLPGEKLIKSPAHDTSEDQDTEQSGMLIQDNREMLTSIDVFW